MLGGGKWDSQNKKLNGAYINIVSKKTSTPKKSIKPMEGLLLTDINGVLIKTADGFYLAVKE